MGSFLLTSIVASVVLTVLLNVVPRLFPGASRRAEEKMHDFVVDAERAREQRRANGDTGESGSRVKVYAPWKAMLIGSIALTVLVNLVALLF